MTTKRERGDTKVAFTTDTKTKLAILDWIMTTIRQMQEDKIQSASARIDVNGSAVTIDLNEVHRF